jgi:hypothetical protein
VSQILTLAANLSVALPLQAVAKAIRLRRIDHWKRSDPIDRSRSAARRRASWGACSSSKMAQQRKRVRPSIGVAAPSRCRPLPQGGGRGARPKFGVAQLKKAIRNGNVRSGRNGGFAIRAEARDRAPGCAQPLPADGTSEVGLIDGPAETVSRRDRDDSQILINPLKRS